MKILVLGSSAGTDFVCQQLLKDSKVEKVYHSGGYTIYEPTERYVPLTLLGTLIHDVPVDLIEFLKTVDVDLVIPMTHYYQFYEELRDIVNIKNIPTLMPSRANGMLEWSKIETKSLLNKLGIPTPNYQIFDKEKLLKNFFDISRPFVLKYEQDYRAGLQTSIINDENCKKYYEYLISPESQQYSQSKPQTDNQQFIVEEFLKGDCELSYHALCNAQGWQYLGSARDYKKLYDGDVGVNTAGMGAYSPVQNVHPKIADYVDLILNYLKHKGDPFIGVLYVGIMMVGDTPYVLELNTRPGDPEIQPILKLVKNDLADIFYAAATNKPIPKIEFSDTSAVSVRIVNKIYNLAIPNETTPFKSPDLWPLPGNIQLTITNNRRLLNSILTAEAETIERASDIIYKFLKNKPMYKFRYRKDIGYLK